MKIFSVLTAGDSANWLEPPLKRRDHIEPLISAAWTLTYELRGPSSLTLAGVPDGDGWRVKVSPTDSAALEPGAYTAVMQIVRPDERLTVGRTNVTVMPDPLKITAPIDARSIAEKALADCEAALASFSGSNGKIKSYTIGGRSTEFQSLADIMSLRNFWSRQVRLARAKASGRKNPSALIARFP
ncbi:hypothetical protein [Duganella sp. Root336D2]|uniref:hypothetical protein n=1 Tax=Duganella sp. Root336D2 TaxID=1736518 RepID=UPI0006FFD428|nr:hypothetical protein [Duganella sp. Root336D2]KQV51350.1 hypothetical protein ASD07_10675 [Duganella sp. Root336D2]